MKKVSESVEIAGGVLMIVGYVMVAVSIGILAPFYLWKHGWWGLSFAEAGVAWAFIGHAAYEIAKDMR